LQPGDVIALSNTLIIYGEGEGRDAETPQAQSDEGGVTRQLPPIDG
jgi:hypothetical protein